MNKTQLREARIGLTHLKTQQELFKELSAAQHVADLANQAVEDKMKEMIVHLSPTFKNEGFCMEHPDAPVLQIRDRMNKKLGRSVPYFAVLQAMPKTWLGRDAQDARAAARAEAATVVEIAPANSATVVEGDQTATDVVELDNATDNDIPAEDQCIILS